MKFPLSVWLAYFEPASTEEAIRLLANAGFTQGEITLNHLRELKARGDPEATGRAVQEYARSLGYSIPQGHLSFKGGLCDNAALERLMPELELFAAMGVQKAVLHTGGGNDLPPEERRSRWVHYLEKLSAFVEGSGVTLCVENMYTLPYCTDATGIKGILRDAGGKNLAICLDTGHLHLARMKGNTTQSQRDFILEAGELLQALHVTDNSGLEDTHQMPFSARRGVDWQEVMQALKEIRYKGLFNLEILGERYAPMAVRMAKLTYIRHMCDYMMTEEFLTLNPDTYLPPMEMR